MEKFQEFVSLAPWTIIFTWINLIILVFIMKKLLFKPVTNMLKQREDEVNSMYEKAEGKEDLKINRYCQGDYVRLNVLKTLIGATIGFVLCL